MTSGVSNTVGPDASSNRKQIPDDPVSCPRSGGSVLVLLVLRGDEDHLMVKMFPPRDDNVTPQEVFLKGKHGCKGPAHRGVKMEECMHTYTHTHAQAQTVKKITNLI